MERFENTTPETSPAQEKNKTRLELEHRNPLQRRIIQLSLGEGGVSDSNRAYEWAENNLERISNIIDADTPDGESIRELARLGTPKGYEDAAKKVIELLTIEAADIENT